MTKLVLNAGFDDVLLARLTTVAPELEIIQERLPGHRWPADMTTDAEIIYAQGGVPLPENAPNLQWIQLHWAGADHLRDQPIWQSDVIITTSSGIHVPNLSQYVMTQILAWAHHVPRWLETQRNGRWPESRHARFVPDELRGKTIGILGYGALGREIARLAGCFGMTVLATKKDARQPAHHGYTPPGTGDPDGSVPDRIYPGEATRSMVAECDYIVITLPATADTFHLVDESVLRAMKPTAFLINIGRGSVVDEAALIRALQRGWIAGAGLDVFEQEPLPEESPLWGLENVILTPHIGGFTPHYDARALDLFAQNLQRYLDGQRLLNQVDRTRGY